MASGQVWSVHTHGLLPVTRKGRPSTADNMTINNLYLLFPECHHSFVSSFLLNAATPPTYLSWCELISSGVNVEQLTTSHP